MGKKALAAAAVVILLATAFVVQAPRGVGDDMLLQMRMDDLERKVKALERELMGFGGLRGLPSLGIGGGLESRVSTLESRISNLEMNDHHHSGLF